MSKLVYIQILRACAALSVVMLHAQYDAKAVAARLHRPFHSIDWFPWEAGVDVFFVISGFIIVYSSQKLFAAPGASKIFLLRRIGRIVPLYWSVTTLYLALALIAPGLLNSEILEPWPIVASYLFIPFARPDGLVQPLYSLGWTLNYEMYFYVVFAIAILLPLRRAVPALIGVMMLFVALGRVLHPPQPLAFWMSPLILEFALGMGLALLKTEGVVLPRILRVLFVLAGIGLLVALAGQGLHRAFTHGVPAGLLVAAAALRPDRPETTMNWPARLSVLLGDASYALYLIHPFIVRAGREIVLRTGLGGIIGPWGYIALVLVGATLISILIFRWYERPIMDWVRIRLRRTGASQPASAAR